MHRHPQTIWRDTTNCLGFVRSRRRSRHTSRSLAPPLVELKNCNIISNMSNITENCSQGVINCLAVGREEVAEVGAALCNSPLVRKVSFTGSTNVGKWLMRESASTVKRVSFYWQKHIHQRRISMSWSQICELLLTDKLYMYVLIFYRYLWNLEGMHRSSYSMMPT